MTPRWLRLLWLWRVEWCRVRELRRSGSRLDVLRELAK